MTAGAPKMSERSQRARARAEASQSGTQEDAQAKGKRTATQSRGEGSQGDKKKPRRECPTDKQTQTDATADAAPQPEPSHYECPICMDLLIAPVVSPCGHDFCQHCYEGMMATTGSRLMCHVKCPICREPLPDRLPGVCKRLENTIEQLFPQQLATRRAFLGDELEERAKDRERAAEAQRAQRGENLAFAEVLETIHQLSQVAREGMGGASFGPGGEGAEDAADGAARQPWSSFDWSRSGSAGAQLQNMGERVRSLFTRGGQPAAARAQPPSAAAVAPAGPGTPDEEVHTHHFGQWGQTPGDTSLQLWQRSVRALRRSSQAGVPQSAARMEEYNTSEEDSPSEEPPSRDAPDAISPGIHMGFPERQISSNPVTAPPFSFGSMPYNTPHSGMVAYLPSGPHYWDPATRRYTPISQPASLGTYQILQASSDPFRAAALQYHRRQFPVLGEATAQPLPQPHVPSSTVQLLVQVSAGASAAAGQQASPVPQGDSIAGPAAFVPMNQQLVNGSFVVSGGSTPIPMPAGTWVGPPASPSFTFPTFTMGRVETRSGGRRRRRQQPIPRRNSANH